MQIEQTVDLDKSDHPLVRRDRDVPKPAAGEILIRVLTCGVCHTEIDEIEGRTPPAFFPLTPGHQVVGEVVETGAGVTTPQIGDRVGVAWIYGACGTCRYCRTGQENLCSEFLATGRDVHGGYAEYMVARAAYSYPVPEGMEDATAAPLLCAGAIGLRSLRLADMENGLCLGLTGFGASGHLVLKLVRFLYPDTPVVVFARSPVERTFARQLGAVWSGDTTDVPPVLPDRIIDTTPAWKPVLAALQVLHPGGRLVINAIRKEKRDQDELLKLDYAQHLWMEKEIKSVANVAGDDVRDFLTYAAGIPIIPEVREYPLEDANQAIREIRSGHIRGAKVLRVAG